jgi:hypothetical protein
LASEGAAKLRASTMQQRTTVPIKAAFLLERAVNIVWLVGNLLSRVVQLPPVNHPVP